MHWWHAALQLRWGLTWYAGYIFIFGHLPLGGLKCFNHIYVPSCVVIWNVLQLPWASRDAHTPPLGCSAHQPPWEKGFHSMAWSSMHFLSLLNAWFIQCYFYFPSTLRTGDRPVVRPNSWFDIVSFKRTLIRRRQVLTKAWILQVTEKTLLQNSISLTH